MTSTTAATVPWPTFGITRGTAVTAYRPVAVSTTPWTTLADVSASAIIG